MLPARHPLVLSTVALCSAFALPLRAQAAAGSERAAVPLATRYRAAADSLIRGALSDSAAYSRLAELADRFGARFSGTPGLERAIDWILARMQADGLESVRGEPVMVPRWVRGEESAEIVQPRPHRMRILGLGGSIATAPRGVTAEVMVVGSFEELTARAAEARRKIVLYDVPFTTYGETVRYRASGAVEAARVGALAALVRSVTPHSLQTPHTGSMRYDSTVTRIPAAAVTVEDAELIRRLRQRGERVVLTLRMGARMLPDVRSRNVVAEIRGSERPEEVVVIGGHIDSWDVGQGAMDDGGGSVVAWEAVRLMHRLGLRPRRTVRVVLWTNEENGLRGANAYRDAHVAELDQHVLAIESDAGVFRPRGFGFTGSDTAYAMVKEIGTLLASIGADSVARGGGGADIGPIMARGVPGMGLNVDGTRYFWYHHTDADTMDKLNPREMAMCVATMAVMAYVVADMEERLPRAISSAGSR